MKYSVSLDEFEKVVFSENEEERPPYMLPFYMKEERDENGEFFLDIETYSGVYDIANEFAKKFIRNPFSDKALSWIYEKVNAYLNEYSFIPERGSKGRFYYSYEMKDLGSLNTSLIRNDSILLDKNYESLLLYDTNELLSKGLYSFVTLEDGKIISIASVNENINESKMLEITVETEKNSRGKGYASSNVSSLCKYLLERGYYVSYCCSRYNKASRKIAEKAGFRESGRFFAIAGYR